MVIYAEWYYETHPPPTNGSGDISSLLPDSHPLLHAARARGPLPRALAVSPKVTPSLIIDFLNWAFIEDENNESRFSCHSTVSSK